MRCLWALLVLLLLASGCSTMGSVDSTSTLVPLKISVFDDDMDPLYHASIYLDGMFIGTVNKPMSVIYVERGEWLIRVECPDFDPYENVIKILGAPNEQALNIVLDD